MKAVVLGLPRWRLSSPVGDLVKFVEQHTGGLHPCQHRASNAFISCVALVRRSVILRRCSCT